MESTKNGKLSTRQTFMIAVLSAVLGSTGGNYLLSRVFPDAIRPDPFTGTEARVLEHKVQNLEWHVQNHPHDTGRFENRIATLEAQNTLILQELRIIAERLDRMR